MLTRSEAGSDFRRRALSELRSDSRGCLVGCLAADSKGWMRTSTQTPHNQIRPGFLDIGVVIPSWELQDAL